MSGPPTDDAPLAAVPGSLAARDPSLARRSEMHPLLLQRVKSKCLTEADGEMIDWWTLF